MAPDQAQPRSRRALLTAAIGGAAAVLATAVGRPLDARAADGDPVLIGALNEGTATTTLRRTTKGTTLSIRHTGIDLEEGGPALEASSFYGDAVQATVGGISQTAIRATSPDGTAVVARSENAYGVVAAGAWGVKTEGTLGGVYAETTGGYNGKAVQAVATGQDDYALVTSGRIQFGLASGAAVIAVGQKQVTVTPGVKISTATKVMCTLQSSAGGTIVVHRISRNVAANSFTIYLTGTATLRCYVAWLLIG